MPVYTYQAFDQLGKKQKGTVEAESESMVKNMLRDQGLMIAGIAPKKNFRKSSFLRNEKKMAFTMQLAQLVGAGLPLYESLVIIEEQSRNAPYHRIIFSLCEQIKTGKTLSEAMASHPESFDTLYRSMVAAGETVGALEPVLLRLGQFLQRQNKLQRQIRTAMIYPSVLFTFSLLVLALLVGFVVPSIEGIFEDRQLNGFTNFVITTSHILQNWWWLILPTIIATLVSLYYWFKTPAGSAFQQRKGLKIPLIGNLMKQAAVARFCRTLGTLLRGGLPLIDSLRIARKVMGNISLEEEMSHVEKNVVQGSSLSKELKKAKGFPEFVSTMLAVGEESGDMTGMAEKVAEIYEEEVEKSTERMVTLLQPAILLFMGAMIGMILLAILLPLTDVSSLTM